MGSESQDTSVDTCLEKFLRERTKKRITSVWNLFVELLSVRECKGNTVFVFPEGTGKNCFCVKSYDKVKLYDISVGVTDIKSNYNDPTFYLS